MSRYAKQFGRSRLEALTPTSRRTALQRLATELSVRLAPFAQWDDYWREVETIIEELKQDGHDLWSHDYDGAGCHLWGWNYMQLETAGYLQLQFEFGDRVLVFWRTEDPQLGALSRQEREELLAEQSPLD